MNFFFFLNYWRGLKIELKRQWLKKMKRWTKKKKIMLKDVVHKELYKIYYKISIIIYSIDIYRLCIWFLIIHLFHYLVMNI